MRWKAVLGALARAVLVLAAGCTSSSSQAHKAYTSSSSSHEEHKAYAPHINAAEFTTKVDNNYFPLKPSTTFVYQANKQCSIRDEMAVTNQTKNAIGVQCVVVNDKAWKGANLIERPYDWFALR
jgi:maltose-binding protein MalE